MIKIERITADKPTVLRNGVRQPVTLGMTVTQAELETIEAVNGTIIYSVDETQVKTLAFEAPVVVAKPVIKQPIKSAAKTAKITLESTVTTEDKIVE